MTDELTRMEDFSRDISDVINRYGLSSSSGTLDSILGDFLTSVLVSYNDAIEKRDNGPIETVEESSKSHFQMVLDDLINEQTSHRAKYFKYLMSNPGVISTFGDDFVVEYHDMHISELRQPGFNPLDEYRISLTQEVRFYRREVWNSMQNANDLGLSDEVRELQNLLSAARKQGDECTINSVTKQLNNRADDLSNLGLRINSQGNLESV